MKIAIFATGYKGYKFLCKLKNNPQFVVSYDNRERRDQLHYRGIKQWCADRKIPFYERGNLEQDADILSKVDKVFVVGWQYLIKENTDKIVVFHDSYLPERRGFSPTLSSLLETSPYLGASCFQPSDDLSKGPDYGKVYDRQKIVISYPITLKEAFDLVVDKYVQMACSIVEENIIPTEINYDKSTFSLWRDKRDLRLDWKQPSGNVYQKILGLGFPYKGATAVYDSQIIHIQDATECTDIKIENVSDHYGKIWKIENKCPYIVCGEGVIRINKAFDSEGKAIIFDKIRKRLE